MSHDSLTLCENALSLAATYWLHSAFLIGGVWLWLKLRPTASNLLQERLWKYAAIAGLVTTALQASTGTGIPVLSPRERASVEDSHADVASAPIGTDLNLSVEDSLALVRESINSLRSSTSETTPNAALIGDTGHPRSAESHLDAPREHIGLNSLSSARNINTELQPATGPPRTEARGIASADKSQSHPKPALPLIDEQQTPAWLFPIATLLTTITAAGLLWFCVEWLLFWQTTRGLHPATWQQLQTLDDVRKRLGVRRGVELLVGDRFDEPVAFGIWQWKVVLPAKLDSQLTREELSSLLAHEIAHLSRGDVWWLHIGRLLTTLLCWQPLNFLASRQWQLHAEFQCDDWAIGHSIDALSLARCLTVVAEWRSAKHLGAVALPAGGSRAHITDRVERLLSPVRRDHWSSPRRRIALATAFLSVASSLALAGPRISRAEIENKPRQVTDSVTSDGHESEQQPSMSKSNDVQRALESQLKSESALLALEMSLLAEELADLETQLASAPSSPEIQAAVNRLRSRLKSLGNMSMANHQNLH
ncbi:MAG: M56 family metallopeptidase [Planctomycetota bacterium]|jgi:beta-lactamase regulating signal transducer with metallopeptidase domain